MERSRRAFLAAAGASAVGVAGCLGDNNDDPPGNGGNDSESSLFNDIPDDVWKPLDDLPDLRDRTVVDFGNAPLTAAVSGHGIRTEDRFYVTLDFQSAASDVAPAVVTALVVNRQPFRQTIRSRRLAVFDNPPLGRTIDRDVAYLAPTADHPLAESVPAIEQDDAGRWRVDAIDEDWFPETVTAPAESGFVAEYYLLGHHQLDEPPIGPGYYQFASRDDLEVAVWPTDEPGPEVDSQFTGTAPPALPDEEPMAWYHDASPDTEVFLEPSQETVSPPEIIEFTFTNHGRERASGNPHYWRLYKLLDEEWFPVDPWWWTLPLGSVGPGGRRESALAIFHGKSISCKGAREVSHLGGGTYAYEVGFSLGDETHSAMFVVKAPALEVQPQADIQIEVDGETIEVTHPDYKEGSRPTTVTITPAGSDEDVDLRLIPEQLPRHPFQVFRNSLPLFEPNIEEVRVRTSRGIALRPFWYDEDESLTLQYDESTYRATAEVEADD